MAGVRSFFYAFGGNRHLAPLDFSGGASRKNALRHSFFNLAPPVFSLAIGKDRKLKMMENGKQSVFSKHERAQVVLVEMKIESVGVEIN